MKNNRFYANRMAIKEVCEREYLSVLDGARAWAKESGQKDDYLAELAAWDKLCAEYANHTTKTLADLFREDSEE